MKITSKIFFYMLVLLSVFIFLERFILVSFDTSTIRVINYISFSLVVLISLLLGYKNHITGERRIVWYVLSLFLTVGSVFYIYTIYSLSSFGF